jgi:hypothetical protein
MKSNRRVLLFVIYSLLLFLLVSFAGIYFNISWLPFKRINLIADIVHPPVKKPKPVIIIAPDTTQKKDTPVISRDSIASTPREDFALYQAPRFITDFSADTLQASLDSFSKKLHELRTGVKRKVRIAYFGDSMIEGDLLTQTLRQSLQQLFGGTGVGYVPITSPVSQFRITAVANYSETWENENLKEGRNNRLFLSGYSFHTSNGWVQIRDYSIKNDSVTVTKSLLCGNTSKQINIAVNNQSFSIKGDSLFNRIVLNNDKAKSIRVAISNDKLPVYGVTFESDSGIFLDNFAFRGISGVELAKIDSAFLSAIANTNPYDLIVFQYGVNLLFRPNENNFTWYREAMQPIVRKFRNCFPQSDIVIISTADRAFRYNGEYKSAVGIDTLIKEQALLAHDTKSVFYNQFASMGGTNSIVEWTKTKPSMANKDYVHPNFRGAEVLGHYLFDALMRDYEKYVHSLK